ncbi:small nuclear ribonucleoprotein D3, partial [Tremellales sp. Uapishka_1]
MANLGVPVKLLHESLGHIVTVELKTGERARADVVGTNLILPLLRSTGPSYSSVSPFIQCFSIYANTLFSILSCTPSRPTAEDSMNISLREITVTARDGRVSQLEQVYIRGSMIRFMIVPDLLANAPMFKRVGPNAMRGRGIGAARGRATIMRANSRRGTTRGQGVRR